MESQAQVKGLQLEQLKQLSDSEAQAPLRNSLQCQIHAMRKLVVCSFHSISFPSEWEVWRLCFNVNECAISFHSISFPSEWEGTFRN